MVETNAYRVLSNYSYDGEERRIEPTTKPNVSNVSLPYPFNEVSVISEHVEFIQMVINAKTMVDVNNSRSPIAWRGYSTSIGPEFKLSKDSVTKELVQALLNITNLSPVETKVLIDLFIPYETFTYLFIYQSVHQFIS